MLASLLALAACVPRYSSLPAIEPDELWAPGAVRHVVVDTPGVAGVSIAFTDSAASGVVPADPDAVPLVFVHGLSSTMGFWEYQLPHFQEQRRVLALDLPGYGMSGRPDAPYTPPWYAEVLDAWLDAVGLERVVIVGHSMGGQIALTFALHHPDRVAGLILSAPAGFERFSPGEAAWMKRYWTEDRAMQAREDELRATFTRLVFNRHDDGVERLLRERVQLGRSETFAGTSVAVSRSIAGMLDHPVWDRLGEVRTPTLIVFGSDDRMIPNPVFTGGTTRSVARQGAAALPDAALVMVPGAGHTVHHDAPDRFNEAVDWFLAGRLSRRHATAPVAGAHGGER
ncbi:MAG: alpha/beta hydrolase [Deltaproteobacteria bacterium]|nr:MAG: alpha/beta hydrolase [Deltaproteobacteria bacterium]